MRLNCIMEKSKLNEHSKWTETKIESLKVIQRHANIAPIAKRNLNKHVNLDYHLQGLYKSWLVGQLCTFWV